MKHPIQVMKIIGILLLLTLFFLSAAMTVQAAPQVLLTKIEKQEGINRTKLTFYFSALPKFQTDHSGQRIDLLLTDVQVSGRLPKLPEDENVVKIMLAQKYQNLLASVLLRRVPNQLVAESLNNPARVVIDLSWVESQGARPGVAFRIADMPEQKTSKKARDFSQESPWVGRWREFFREYHGEWSFTAPLNYTQPALPPLITEKQDPLWFLQNLAANQQWQSLQRDAAQLQGLEEAKAYQRDLLIAEAQVRSGAFSAALARLQQLEKEEDGERQRVEYLTAFAQASSGQPFVAQLTLQGILPDLGADHPLAVPVALLAAETALDSKQEKLALKYLQNTELGWPDSLLAVRDLRLADALAGLGQRDQALERYRDLVEDPGLCEAYPQSCNLAAFTAFKQGDYHMAERLYRKMAETVKDLPNDDMLLFAAGIATYEAGDLDWGLIALQKTTLERPNTEGAGRAELRLIDHRLLSEGELGMARAANEYGQLGKNAVSREVREEASFKQALSQFLLSDYRESVAHLMQFRRNFASSPLRREADLLLLEQIPLLVDRLLAEKNDLQAVVLVEQNRDLLLRGGFSREFLHDLAGAFDRLGLYERAGRVLLFMFDQSANEAQKKPIYLPLAESYLKRGNFVEATDYAGRYLEKYPHGEDAGALFGVLLDAFAAQGRPDDLLAWLNRKDRPTSPELEIRAAWIYWELGNMAGVVKSLELARQSGGQLEVKEMALLGEACFQLNKNAEARGIYQDLQIDPVFGAQARYRTAQLLFRDRQPALALNLLNRMVEEDGKSPWGKLAQDLLIQTKR